MSKKDKAEKAKAKAPKADKAEKSGKSAKIEKLQATAELAKPDKPGKASKSDKAEQGGPMDDHAILLISRALSDPRRVEVLRKIATSDKATCGDVSTCLGMNPATLSHHMRQLSMANLIDTERDGKFVRVTLRRKTWKNYVNHLKDFAA